MFKHKCKKCGEYNGHVKDDSENVEISCLCSGIPCPKCKINNVRKPISNYYDKESGEIWHTPSYSGLRNCDDCRKSDAKQGVQS